MKPPIFFLVSLISFSVFAQKQITNFVSAEEISSYPSNFVEFKGWVYYLATDATHGRNIWRTDGTPEGTEFFLEADKSPDRSNQFLSYKTTDALYFATKNNVWKIGNDNKPKQLNDNSIAVASSIFAIKNRLFLNLFTYLDLNTDKITQLNPNNISSRFPRFEQYHGRYASSETFLAFTLYDTLHVLKAASADFRSYRISKELSTNWQPIQNVFNFKNRDYILFTDCNLYEVTADSLSFKAHFPHRILYSFIQNSEMHFWAYDAEKNNLCSDFVFDGDNFRELRRVQHEPSLHSLKILQENEQEITALAPVFNQYWITQLVKINKQNLSLSAMPTETVSGVWTPSVSNKLLYIGNTDTQSTWHDKDKSIIQMLDLNTGKIFTYSNYAGLFRFEEKNMLLACVNTAQQGQSNYELFRISPEIQVLKNVSDPDINQIALMSDGYSGVGYIALNEKQKGKSIYKLDPKNNQLFLVYNRPDSLFYLNKKSNSNQGTFVAEDFYIWGESINQKYSSIGIYQREFLNFQHLIIDKDKNAVVEFPLGSWWNNALIGDYVYSIEDGQINKQILSPESKKEPIKMPTKVNGYYMLQDNQFFYKADSSSMFRNQLFVYSIGTGFIKLSEEEIKMNFYWNGYLGFVEASGKVFLIEPKTNFKKYYIMTIDETENLNIGTTNKDFFTISTLDKLWYSDGSCENSKLIDQVKYKADGAFYSIQAIANSKSLLFFYDGASYFYDGKQKIEVSMPKRWIGITKNAIYYSNYAWNNPQASYDLLQYNFYTRKTNIITSIDSSKVKNDFTMYMQDVSTVAGTSEIYLRFGESLFLVEAGEKSDKVNIETPNNIPNSNATILYALNDGKKVLRTYGGGLYLILLDDGKRLDTLVRESTYLQMWEKLESNNYLYLQAMAANTIRAGIVIFRLYRISKKDFSVKRIDLPYSVQSKRTFFDGSATFPILLIGNKIYASIESPEAGYQLWELDEAEQQIELANTQAAETFKLSEKCVYQNTQQLIPTEKPETALVFPNPTFNDLSLQIPERFVGKQIRFSLYNTVGNEILDSVDFAAYSHLPNVLHLNLPTYLSSGKYFLKLQSDSEQIIFQFVRL